jgi:hypothetical protein
VCNAVHGESHFYECVDDLTLSFGIMNPGRCLSPLESVTDECKTYTLLKDIKQSGVKFTGPTMGAFGNRTLNDLSGNFSDNRELMSEKNPLGSLIAPFSNAPHMLITAS